MAATEGLMFEFVRNNSKIVAEKAVQYAESAAGIMRAAAEARTRLNQNQNTK